MRRRTFVTTAGIVGAAALAGCATESNDDGDDNDNGDDNGGGATTPPEDRVDAPPHDPERPPRNEDEWDPHWLGAGMTTEPSLSFETVDARLTDRRLGGPSDTDPEFAVTLVTTQEELSSRVDLAASGDRLETVDFDAEAVVVVESGYGSSSIRHAWQRVEEVENGIHLHGYHVEPFVQTDDISRRHSIAVVETPLDGDDRAHVSLTYSGDWRANFDSTEGVVGVGSDDEPDTDTGPDY